MANQTLTAGTPSAPVNFDSATLSGLANGETITINGGHLLIDGDNRWGSNAAVFGSMPISATLGGSILIDGRNVWEVPFSASTGNVPTVADAGSNAVTGSGITGELLRVWATGSLTPAASGGAMPATGWIKLRSKTGDFSNGLVVTLPGGATITCAGAGKRSWIQVVGGTTGTITVPRLGELQILGDWYELGTTNGAGDQTFQYPAASPCPAVQIETSPGSGVYEWFLCAGSRWGTATQFVSTDARGKYVGVDNATGVITVARRASNACGYLPPAGCKVRIPNILLLESNTAASFDTNVLTTAMASRYDLTTAAGGKVTIDKVSSGWTLSTTNAYQFTLSDSAIGDQLVVSNAVLAAIDGLAIGLSSNLDFPSEVSGINNIVLANARFVRYQATGTSSQALNINDCVNASLQNVQVDIFGTATAVTRGNAGANTLRLRRVSDFSAQVLSLVGACMQMDNCSNVTLTDVRYADALMGSTTSTNFASAIKVTAGATVVGLTVDGFSAFAGLANLHTYGAIVEISSGSNGAVIKNIGTPSAPYDCGGSSTGSSFGVNFGGFVSDLVVRRVYLQNVRFSPVASSNGCSGVVLDNVWGDAASSQAIASLNTVARGCRWTNSVAGQTAVYGRHWEDAWTSTTAGRILIACNEPTEATADQCEITGGNAAFTSAGQVAMGTVGDQVTWTMPYFCLGVTALANSAPTITGAQTGNITYEFQYDLGSGFNGSWLTLNAANLSGVGAINPNVGIRLKVRATTVTANTANALTYIRIDTVTNATDQQIQYPLPKTSLTVFGFETGTDIIIYDATVEADGSGSNVLASGDAVSGSSFVFEYEGTPTVSIGAFKPGRVPVVTPPIVLPAIDSTYPIIQRADRNYQ